jgi:hypothetical protein
VFLILAYTPVLLCLPLLLVVGLVFVVVPGGFIVVLGGLYYAWVGFTGLLGFAAARRWQARGSRIRRAHANFDPGSRPRQPSVAPRGAPAAVTLGFRNDRAAGSRLALSRRGTGDAGRAATLDPGRASDRQDRARAA